jgi:hypothetical protein
MRIELLSPRSTQPYQTEASSPITTSADDDRGSGDERALRDVGVTP